MLHCLKNGGICQNHPHSLSSSALNLHRLKKIVVIPGFRIPGLGFWISGIPAFRTTESIFLGRDSSLIFLRQSPKSIYRRVRSDAGWPNVVRKFWVISQAVMNFWCQWYRIYPLVATAENLANTDWNKRKYTVSFPVCCFSTECQKLNLAPVLGAQIAQPQTSRRPVFSSLRSRLSPGNEKTAKSKMAAEMNEHSGKI